MFKCNASTRVKKCSIIEPCVASEKISSPLSNDLFLFFCSEEEKRAHRRRRRRRLAEAETEATAAAVVVVVVEAEAESEDSSRSRRTSALLKKM